MEYVLHSHLSIKKTARGVRPLLLLLSIFREAQCPFLEGS